MIGPIGDRPQEAHVPKEAAALSVRTEHTSWDLVGNDPFGGAGPVPGALKARPSMDVGEGSSRKVEAALAKYIGQTL